MKYPSDKVMKSLADAARPKERPIAEFAPVTLGPPPPQYNWVDFKARPSDVVDDYHMQNALIKNRDHELHRKSIQYLQEKNGGTGRRKRAR